MKKSRGVVVFFIKMLLLKVHRKRNKNKSFTLISRNCVGGMVYHQYGLQFRSPTINLFIKLNEFNYFCLYLRDYISGVMVEDFIDGYDYPVGKIVPKNKKLPSIHVFFMHYNSYGEAFNKWNERKKRINWNNIFVVSDATTEAAEGLINEAVIDNFNKIPYPKIIFVRRQYGFDDEFILKSRKNKKANLLENKGIFWKKEFNQFNWNNFLKNQSRFL